MSKVVLALGSNLTGSNPRETIAASKTSQTSISKEERRERELALVRNLEKAVRLLGEKITIEKVSSIYESSPVDFIEQADFLNLVLTAETNLTPKGLLDLALTVEAKMKSRKLVHKGPRIIDIDIIFYGDLTYHKKDLTIPHPAFKNRLFVLLPLLEIDKNYLDPTNGKLVKEYVKDELYEKQSIKSLVGH